MQCRKGEVCSWRPRNFPDHECKLNLRSGDNDFVPCDTDNGTGDKELVAFNRSGKILWTSKLGGSSRPEFMTVLQDSVLVRNNTLLEAFERTTGVRRWQKTITGNGFAVTPDLGKLLAGDGQTMMALDPADGHEIAKLGPWLPVAEKTVAP